MTLPPDIGIVYCSCVDWANSWERMHQFAWMFAHERAVVYIDNPGVRPLRWDHLPRIVNRLGRAFHRNSHTALPVHADRRLADLHLLSPLLIPSPTDPICMGLNRKLFRRQVRQAMRQAVMERAILWTSSPTDPVIGLLEDFPWEMVVYDCVDDLPALHPYRARQLQAAEDRLLSRADVVLVTARALEEKLQGRGREEVHCVPNGIDLARFARPSETPPALAALPWPVVGFLGSMLPHVFDVDLMIRVAEMHPEWSVVLVGPMHPTLAARARGSRLHLLGPVDYADVPAYLRAFDVAVVPFVESSLTRAINPLKVYEYLACGLPVVSTPLPEVDIFGDLVAQVSGATAFAEAIELALAEGGRHADLRQGVAARHSWDERFRQVVSILARAFQPSR